MSIPSWLVKGAKVVCVDTKYHGTGSRSDASKLRFMETYEVEWVGFIDGYPVVRLVGIACISPGYRPSRFRPAISKKTQDEDVAMIKSLVFTKIKERA